MTVSVEHVGGQSLGLAAVRVLPAATGNGASQLMPNQQSIVETPRPTYQEFVPPSPLRDHVVCFWRHGPTETSSTARVIPDGCIDVVWVDDRPPHIAGPMTKPVLYGIDGGTEIFAVRLRPGVAHRLLGQSAKDLLNQDVSLHDLWPRTEVARWERVTEQRDDVAKLALIAEVVASRLDDDRWMDDFVARAASWLAGHPFAPLDEISRRSGLSERQIRRRFDEAIGYGPKKLQRILRLQRLLWLAGQQRRTRPQLSALAFAAGYADQPHMTREVIALTGTSPGQLLLGSPRSAVSDLFKTTVP
jgi:AraC-like DNA-binding protein